MWPILGIVGSNPYAPPRTRAPSPPPGPRAYGPLSLCIYTLLAPPLGAILTAINLRRLQGRPGLLRGLVLFVAPAFGLAWFGAVHRDRSLAFLTVAGRIALAAITYVDQRPLVRKHVEAGRAMASWWGPLLVFLPLLVAALAAWQVLAPGSPRAR